MICMSVLPLERNKLRGLENHTYIYTHFQLHLADNKACMEIILSEDTSGYFILKSSHRAHLNLDILMCALKLFILPAGIFKYHSQSL